MLAKAADLDNDGDLDIMVASPPGSATIVGFINSGDQEFVRMTLVNSSGGASNVQALQTIDVDNDGDLDFVAANATSFNGSLNWYEQTSILVFARRTVASSMPNAFAVTAADLDRDGDVDIVSGRPSFNGLAWYENNGSETFTAHTLTTSSGTQLTSVQTIDMNNDGGLDILYATTTTSGFLAGSTAWFGNNGNRTFTFHTVASPASSAVQALAADLDGDGDMDVSAIRPSENAVVWYKNVNGTFSTEVITTGNGALSINAADLDGDGDLDLQAADSSAFINFKNLNSSPSPGDYNHDALVENADFDLWRGNFGTTFDVRPDGTGDHVVDSADYVIWRHYESEIATLSGEGENLADTSSTALQIVMSKQTTAVAAQEVPNRSLSETSDAAVAHSLDISTLVIGDFRNVKRQQCWRKAMPAIQIEHSVHEMAPQHELFAAGRLFYGETSDSTHWINHLLDIYRDAHSSHQFVDSALEFFTGQD